IRDFHVTGVQTCALPIFGQVMTRQYPSAILFGGFPMRRLLLATTLLASLAQAAEPIAIDVHRDANCGCCKDWIKHLEDNGFAVSSVGRRVGERCDFADPL